MEDIIQLKKGNIFVFNRIYEELHKQLYHYLLSKTGSLYYAEEITQITFIKLWKCKENLNENIKLDIQLFRIAKTTMIDQLRYTSGFQKMQGLLAGKASKNADYNNGPESLQEKEIQYKLQKTLSQLPPMQKKVFELSRFYHLSHKEIATLQSISIKTVESHMNQALRKIKGAFLFLVVFSFF